MRYKINNKNINSDYLSRIIPNHNRIFLEIVIFLELGKKLTNVILFELFILTM